MDKKYLIKVLDLVLNIKTVSGLEMDTGLVFKKLFILLFKKEIKLEHNIQAPNYFFGAFIFLIILISTPISTSSLLKINLFKNQLYWLK